MLVKPLEFVVNHGKTGAVGRFITQSSETFGRGDRVVLDSHRGLTVGVVLCEATGGNSRFLAFPSLGQLLRRVRPDDECAQRTNQLEEQQIYEVARGSAAALNLPMEILDCELSLDRRRVILQYLLRGNCDPAKLMQSLADQFEVDVWLENLAVTVGEPDHEDASGGCGEPNCGRANGGGCDTCSTGGGCSSCGHGKVDMRAYFAHLREKMEISSKIPLL